MLSSRVALARQTYTADTRVGCKVLLVAKTLQQKRKKTEYCRKIEKTRCKIPRNVFLCAKISHPAPNCLPLPAQTQQLPEKAASSGQVAGT